MIAATAPLLCVTYLPKNMLGMSLGTMAMTVSIGAVAGPAIGGLITHYLTWHWIFLINIPIGILGAVAALRFMPNLPKPEKPEPFDRWGFALFGVAMIAITMAFEGVGELHLAITPMVLLFFFGLTCLVVYCLHALRAPHPLFSPELFRTRNFTVGILGNLFARLGNGAMPFLTPLLLQLGLGFSPLKSGLTMIPMTVSAMLAKRLIQPLLDRLGYRRLLIGNTLCLGVLIACFSFIDKEMPYLEILLLFSVFGVVNSMQFTAMNTLTLIDVPGRYAAAGNGMLSVVMQVSMGMGVACAAAILGEFSGLRTAAPPLDVLDAFHKTYLCLGVMAAISAAIFSHARRMDEKSPEAQAH